MYKNLIKKFYSSNYRSLNNPLRWTQLFPLIQINYHQNYHESLINNKKKSVTFKHQSPFRNFSNSSERNIDDKNNKQQQQMPRNDDDDNESENFPLLMDFVPRGMPNLWYSLKNFYLINFVIRNQIDCDFVFKDFIEGAKQALILVSSHLANNRLDQLEDLIEPKALEEIRKNYGKLSLAHRKEYELIPSDIVLAFAHHIDVQTLKEEFTGTHKYILNFFIVFDCIRNLEEILKEKARSTEKVNPREIFKEFSEQKVICNYEFKREYIQTSNDKHEASDWIITKLLHIKEKDLVRFYQT